MRMATASTALHPALTGLSGARLSMNNMLLVSPPQWNGGPSWMSWDYWQSSSALSPSLRSEQPFFAHTVVR